MFRPQWLLHTSNSKEHVHLVVSDQGLDRTAPGKEAAWRLLPARTVQLRRHARARVGCQLQLELLNEILPHDIAVVAMGTPLGNVALAWYILVVENAKERRRRSEPRVN